MHRAELWRCRRAGLKGHSPLKLLLSVDVPSCVAPDVPCSPSHPKFLAPIKLRIMHGCLLFCTSSTHSFWIPVDILEFNVSYQSHGSPSTAQGSRQCLQRPSILLGFPPRTPEPKGATPSVKRKPLNSERWESTGTGTGCQAPEEEEACALMLALSDGLWGVHIMM